MKTNWKVAGIVSVSALALVYLLARLLGRKKGNESVADKMAPVVHKSVLRHKPHHPHARH